MNNEVFYSEVKWKKLYTLPAFHLKKNGRDAFHCHSKNVIYCVPIDRSRKHPQPSSFSDFNPLQHGRKHVISGI